jgi:uridine kinase
MAAVVVAVVGASCSGKTAATRGVAARLRAQGLAVAVIHQDDFYWPDAALSQLPPVHLGAAGPTPNLDCPAALDSSALEVCLLRTHLCSCPVHLQ